MSRLAATNPMPRFTVSSSASRRDPRRRADGCGRVIHGVDPREPRGPAVEKEPTPELERDQGPQLQIQWPASSVPLEETLDVPLVEDSAPPAGLREQQVADEAAEPAPEPPAERHCEPLLPPVDDGVGQDASHGALEDVFGHPVAQ